MKIANSKGGSSFFCFRFRFLSIIIVATMNDDDKLIVRRGRVPRQRDSSRANAAFLRNRLFYNRLSAINKEIIVRYVNGPIQVTISRVGIVRWFPRVFVSVKLSNHKR